MKIEKVPPKPQEEFYSLFMSYEELSLIRVALHSVLVNGNGVPIDVGEHVYKTKFLYNEICKAQKLRPLC